MKYLLNKSKEWLYMIFVQKHFIEDIRAAQARGEKYGMYDTEKKYEWFRTNHWHVDPHQVISARKMIDKASRTTHVALLVNNEPLQASEAIDLKAEVAFFKNSRLWKIMQETVRQQAIEKAVLQSKNYEEVLSGKLMIHNLSIQNDILKIVDDFEVPHD